MNVNNNGIVTGEVFDNVTSVSISFVYDSLGLIGDEQSGKNYDIRDLVNVPIQWNSGVIVYDKNDNNFEIVGKVTDTAGNSAAFYADLSQATGTAKAVFVELGTAVSASAAYGINDDGDIILRVDDAVGSWLEVYFTNLATLNTLIGTGIEQCTRGSGISNRSYDEFGNLIRSAQITGNTDLNSPNGERYRYRYTLGDPIQDIENISSQTTAEWLDGRDINDSGEICGRALFADVYRVFLAGSSFEFLTDPWDLQTRGLNNFGDVVGDDNIGAFLLQSDSSGGHDFYYLGNLIEPGEEKDFWISATSWTAGNINDFGQITAHATKVKGKGRKRTVEVRLYLLTPEVTTPTPGITVTPTSGLVTTESGGTDSFDVVLDTQPTADVTIGISSDNIGEGTANKASLTFTTTNWDTPQTVTVTGVDDAIEDGDQTYSIVTAAATSSDPDYNGLGTDDVSVTNEDDDSPPGGGTEIYFSDDTPLAIPDNNSGGVSSNILAGDHLITSLTVNLNISHQRPGDLDVFLIGPDDTQVQLFNFSGDNNVPDFNGTSSLGLWTVQVIDSRNKKTGTLNSWSITIDY